MFLRAIAPLGARRQDNRNDQSEQAQHGAKDFNNQHLDKELLVGGVGQGGGGADNSDTNTANKI